MNRQYSSSARMNIDTLSYLRNVRSATSEVLHSSQNGSWTLLGYVQQNSASRLSLLPINVIKQGEVWIDLLRALEDDLILYAFVKMEDLTTDGTYKTFFIHWIGEKVSENVITDYAPHLHEIRNILPEFDCLISSMNAKDIQKKVHQYLSQTQEVNRSRTPCKERSRRNTLPNSAPPHYERKEKVSKQKSSAVRCATPLSEDELDLEPELSRIKYTSSIKFKVSVIGEAGVGKTSMYRWYKGGGVATNSSIHPTTEIDQFQRSLEIGDCELTLDIWDTAGQERYKSFASCWLRNAYIVMLVYDITDEPSFLALADWLALGRQYAKREAVFVLVGNKADLEARRVVSLETATDFADKHGFMFTECSGLTGYNILHLFDLVARRLLATFPDRFRSLEAVETMSIIEESNIIRLSTENTPLQTPFAKSKRKCCLK